MRVPDDFHRDLRQPPLLRLMARHIYPFGRILAMPNTTPPVATGAQAVEYAKSINDIAPLVKVVPCIKLLRSTTPAVIGQAAQLGVRAVKYYPGGMTTNSEDGISVDELLNFRDVLAAISEKSLLLLLHGEHDKSELCLDREKNFLPVVERVLKNFPGLRVVLEHITTAEAVMFVADKGSSGKHIAATITPHHLRITLNDVIGDKLAPHNFCKPVAKHPNDRKALISAATCGRPYFFLGTDDAPHLRGNKECAASCAGVFTGPYGLLHYAEVFEEAEKFLKLRDFASKFGAEFYGLPQNEGIIELKHDPHTIPAEIDGVVPFMAGSTLNWQIAS